MSSGNRRNKYVYNPIINKKFEGQSAVEAITNIVSNFKNKLYKKLS